MSSDQVSLKEIERRAYRSTFEDGFYDLAFGGVFLVFALTPILAAIGISRFIGYCLLVVPLIVFWLGKRFVTVPRMGAVEFGQKRKKRSWMALIVGAAVLFFTLPLFLMIGNRDLSGVAGWQLIAMFVAPFVVLIVYAIDFPRLYIYAALLIVGPIQAEILLRSMKSPLNVLFSFGLPGVVVTAIGVYLLARFISTHPRSEASYAE